MQLNAWFIVVFFWQPNELPRRPCTRVYLDETLTVFFSKAFPAVDWILVLSFFVKVVPHNKLSDWTAIVYVTSFLLSFCLHVVGMSRSRCIRGQHQVQWRGSRCSGAAA